MTGVLLLGGLAAAAGPRAAEPLTPEDRLRRGIGDTFFLGVGAFGVHFETEAQKDSPELGVNPTINLEDVLGLDDQRLDLRVDGYWRFARRHRFNFGYVYLGRKGNQTTLAEDIQWDDKTFEAGAIVDSDFDTQQVDLSYDYSFYRSRKLAMGPSLGLTLFKFTYALAGEGTITGPDGRETEGFQLDEDEILAPVPLVGFHVSYSFHPRWIWRTSATFIDVGFDEWSAGVLNLKSLVAYYPARHVSFILGYDRIATRYIDEGDDRFRINYVYDGMFFVVGLAF